MKHLSYIKANKSKDKNLPGRGYIYENKEINGPKILLSIGWSKLSEFADYLKTMKPLNPLVFNQNLCLKVPDSKADWANKEVFTKLIETKKKELNISLVKYNFHFDIGYLDAETSAILQLVDDNIGFNGSRRNNILKVDARQIGISNYVIGRKNCVYVLLARDELNDLRSLEIMD